MMTHTLAGQQVTAAGALLALVTRFADLPAAEFEIGSDPYRADLMIHVHNDPPGFEQWREALDLDPQTANLNERNDFQSLSITARRYGARVRLVGYLPAPPTTA
jgi:hypothetical protein